MYVLGTAGHIDHGKSVLVKALTGIDPDRLREEKERGMTIDLGFAWLTLPDGEEVGIVDVPGHERFIKNMLAGVGGIDLALLIVAANEGVMPQTQEHLAILDLLGIEKGIVAVTKKDLVDAEWLELITLDIEEMISETTLAGAPIIPVSAMTGEGLPDLIARIEEMLQLTPPRKDTGRPRLPVDRIFTIAGSGTVVTGTLIDSSLTVGREVELVPAGLKSRIRGLQTHKHKVELAGPGNRVAVNLVGLTTAQISRGDVLTTPGWLKPTRMISVRLRALPHLRRPLTHNAIVSFHTGASETMAKVRLLEGNKLEAGQSAWAQVSLEEPVAVVKGDHFIIRSTMDTLGGGTIIDPYTKRLRRSRPEVIESLNVKQQGSADEVLLAALEASEPVDRNALVNQSNLSAGEAAEIINTLLEDGRAVGIGTEGQPVLYSASGWAKLNAAIIDVLTDYHQKFAARPGMPRADLGSRLKLGKNAPAVFQKLIEADLLADEGASIRLSTHRVSLSPEQQKKIDVYLASLAKSPYAPSTESMPEPDLLNLLIGRRDVVKVAEGVIFSASAFDDMQQQVRDYIGNNGRITLAEARDLFQTSRRYVQALLEYLDEKKVTRRTGDERVLY